MSALTDGLLIGLGLALILAKLPPQLMLKLLGWHVVMDVALTILVYILYAGTVRGLMAAAVAGIAISITTSTARGLVGYIQRGRYYPGVFKLNIEALSGEVTRSKER